MPHELFLNGGADLCLPTYCGVVPLVFLLAWNVIELVAEGFWMSVASRDLAPSTAMRSAQGCAAARNKEACGNRLNIRVDALEASVAALKANEMLFRNTEGQLCVPIACPNQNIEPTKSQMSEERDSYLVEKLVGPAGLEPATTPL